MSHLQSFAIHGHDAFDRQIGPTRQRDRYADSRIRTGFNVNCRYCYDTPDPEWSSVVVDGPRRRQACQNAVVVDLRQRRPSMDQITRIGMDTSKHIFQLHGVTAAEEPALRKKLRRNQMVRFFEQLAPTVIAIEACGASHRLARLLQSFGHTVKLIAPQLVKP